MSKYRNEERIQFRLSGRDADEQDAMSVFNRYLQKGYAVREIMVMALRALGGQPEPSTSSLEDELRTIQHNTQAILELLSSGQLIARPTLSDVDNSRVQALIDSATAMVQKGAGRRARRNDEE